MRLRIFRRLAAATLCWAALAPAQSPGRFVQVELENTIKTKKAKVGEKVRTKVMADVVLPNGRKLILGDVVIGELRAVDANSVAISFDQAVANGKKMTLPLSIRAAMMPTSTERERVVAKAGDVVGLDGVTLQVDDSPQHASKFQSSGQELQLKHGLLLMLGVVEGAPAP